MEVGELAAEEVGVVERSKAPAFPPMGELRESLRQWTGDEVREGMVRGGGEENLRHSLGDLLFKGSVPHEPWLVAKKSSRDLRHRRRVHYISGSDKRHIYLYSTLQQQGKSKFT